MRAPPTLNEIHVREIARIKLSEMEVIPVIKWLYIEKEHPIYCLVHEIAHIKLSELEIGGWQSMSLR